MVILKSIFYWIVLSTGFFAFTQNLQKPVSTIKETHKEAKASQKKIKKMDDETKQLMQKYRST